MILSYLKPQYHNFTANNILQRFQNWHFICHVFLLLECIAVGKNYKRHLNFVENPMIFCAGVIMQRGWYPVLIIKYNLNTMVSIGLYQLNELH